MPFTTPTLIELRLSGRCLEGVWRLLRWLWILPGGLSCQIDWRNSIEGRNIEYCFNWLVPFLSLTMDWPLSALFSDVCRVSERCLGDVLGFLRVWGGVVVVGGWYEIDWYQLNKGNFDRLVHSLPGALECLKVVWKVSERCLGAVWVTLDTVWGLWCESNW